jgi:hypothetical protein
LRGPCRHHPEQGEVTEEGRGPAPRSAGGYWARSHGGDIIQHSFWLFDTEENARAAEATFNTLRDMPDAPATFISVDVCEIVGHA